MFSSSVPPGARTVRYVIALQLVVLSDSEAAAPLAQTTVHGRNSGNTIGEFRVQDI